jgi:hypothetical protein
VEVDTIDTSSLGNHHSDDDDNTYASNDGGEVQGDSDSHEPNRGPKKVGPSGPSTTRLTKANH